MGVDGLRGEKGDPGNPVKILKTCIFILMSLRGGTRLLSLGCGEQFLLNILIFNKLGKHITQLQYDE